VLVFNLCGLLLNHDGGENVSKKKQEKTDEKVELAPFESDLLGINSDVCGIAKRIGLSRDVVMQLLLQREIVILNKQVGELLKLVKEKSGS